jgi:prevent-host-death family protein
MTRRHRGVHKPTVWATLAAVYALGIWGRSGRVDGSVSASASPHRDVCTYYGLPCTLGSMEVGIRELRGRLSDYLDRVRAGEEVVVTDRGTAFARIVPIKGGRTLDRAVAEGLVTPAPRPSRTRPARRVKSRGSVSNLVGEQRR